MIKLTFSLLAAVMLSTTLWAETPATLEKEARFRAAAAWFDQQMVSEMVPAGTVAVVHDQEIVWEHAYGTANLATGRAATPETTFSICSISKLFTSVGVMTLVEDGAVDLDADVSEYLPDFSLATNENTIDEPVTIRALLSHSAGIPREGVGTYWNTLEFPDEAELESRVNALGRMYTPFTNYQYSNIGMSLLGKVISEVSESSFSSYIEREIFSPLGLATMRTDLPLADDGLYAIGYTDHDAQGNREPVTFYTLNGLAPAAGLRGSVRDLARFASWQFRLLETGQPEVLERVTLRDMHRVHWMDPGDPAGRIYGLGFSHTQLGDTPVVGHGGYCLGHRSYLALDTRNQVAVTAMVNVNDVSPSALIAAVHDLVASSIQSADDQGQVEGDDSISELMEYEGEYRWPKMPDGTYVLPTASGSLELVNLYSNNPGDTMVFKPLDGDQFQYVREDGDLGATLTFERDDSGKLSAFVLDGYRSLRVDGSLW
jgi:CubicO group peptidase (beta-lactamase class C family)